MKVKFKVKLPTMPNFLILEQRPGRREDGLTEPPKISVGELSDDQIEAFILEWSEAFRGHCVRRRDGLKERQQ